MLIKNKLLNAIGEVSLDPLNLLKGMKKFILVLISRQGYVSDRFVYAGNAIRFLSLSVWWMPT